MADTPQKRLQSDGIIDLVLKYDPEKEPVLRTRLGRFSFQFILNQFRKNIDPALGEKIETVCNRHFYSNFRFLGNISYDERVVESIFSKKLYIRKYPHTATSADLKKIAAAITQNTPGGGSGTA